jgi:hypothetical protein
MARTVSDLIYGAKGMYTIAQQRREEGYMIRQRILPISWNDEAMKVGKKLKIGYFIEEGAVKVCLPSMGPPEQKGEKLMNRRVQLVDVL